jgi:predicted house-cleaning noncanonical NTP pyrophosphatase (MazG superfamily)
MLKEDDLVDESYFTALFSNTYSDEFNALTGDEKRTYDRFSYYIPVMRNFFKYKNGSELNDFRKKMYHCALLMRVNNDSSIKMNYGILEECKYTYSMIRMIRSIDLFFKMKYQEAYAYVNLSNLRDYMNSVLLPLWAIIRAYTFLDYEDDLFEFSLSDFYGIPNSIPNPDWLVASEEDYEEYLEELRKRNEEVAQYKREMEMKREEELKRRAQEDAEIDRIMRNRVSTPPPTVNQAFVERLERAKAVEAVKERPVVVYKSESEIPNILRRRETNPSKEGETLLLFSYGSAESMVYTKRILKTKIKGEMKSYSVQKLVSELPDLLRNERNKANFMRSSNIFFGRKVSEMNNFYRNQLYETLISFCDEIASTSLEDNDLRLSILQNYYGKKKESESLEQYFYNFRFDVFNSIGMYYCFYSSV